MKLSKTQFREISLAQMKKGPQQNKRYLDALVEQKMNLHLRALLAQKRVRILFYYPLSFEANVLKILQKLRQFHEIYIPFMEGTSFKMVPFRLPLKKKKFGVFEAGNTYRKIKKIDIAIVPAIGVDGNLQRVGFGKGMYDRFFAGLKQRPFTIFIQPKLCYTKEHICDIHDISCDLLISPKRVIKKRATIYNRN